MLIYQHCRNKQLRNNNIDNPIFYVYFREKYRPECKLRQIDPSLRTSTFYRSLCGSPLLPYGIFRVAEVFEHNEIQLSKRSIERFLEGVELARNVDGQR